MSDHRRYTDGETYSGFWNTPSATIQQTTNGYEQSYPQHPQQYQYYPAAMASQHNADPYNSHPAIPLSPPSSRPVSVSSDENSLASNSGHLMPLYSTGRPSFHQSNYNSPTNGIKPDPDREDQRHFFQQRQQHMSSIEKVRNGISFFFFSLSYSNENCE